MSKVKETITILENKDSHVGVNDYDDYEDYEDFLMFEEMSYGKI